LKAPSNKPTLKDFENAEVLICNFGRWQDKVGVTWYKLLSSDNKDRHSLRIVSGLILPLLTIRLILVSYRYNGGLEILVFVFQVLLIADLIFVLMKLFAAACLSLNNNRLSVSLCFKENNQMRKLITSFMLAFLLLNSCVTDNMKSQMDEQMSEGVKILLDQEFKKAIGYVELHKLRYGTYPNSLKELKFLSVMDSSMLSQVQYHQLGDAYELNLISTFPKMNGEVDYRADLHYPKEFWKGLGCAKSNLKKRSQLGKE
jgi:hypothetical protein